MYMSKNIFDFSTNVDYKMVCVLHNLGTFYLKKDKLCYT